MEFTLDFGAKVDVLTKGELDESLDPFLAFFRDYAKGLKYVRPTGVAPDATTASGGILTAVPQGYVWMLTFAVIHVSAAATVTIGRGPTAKIPLAKPTTLAAPGWAEFSWSSRQQILQPGDEVSATASAGVLGSWALNVIEAPAEQVFKLIGG
ncbi:MAG: hypothetical protein M0010_15365 [Actinomycetota bacterium]|jgi:hypothetical protein|nr:hypothetical protein [Actinomycetota bacterium]